MIIEDHKMKLTRPEYRKLRESIPGWEWHEYARLIPANVNEYEFMGAPLVACIERVQIYVEKSDQVEETIEIIRKRAGI